MTEELKVRTQTVELELPQGGLKLENGEVLPAVTVAYETYGELTAAKDNVIFICHALSGDAHVAGVHEEDGRKGWWDEMVGPGKGIDTNLYYVVCANILGGCKGTTGPSSDDPVTGRPYGPRFPHITVSDIVDVHVALLRQMGIEKLAAVIGGSFGGMQVLEWTAKYPQTVRRSICIASSNSLSAQALAFDVVGRKAITSDPGWKEGDYYDGAGGPAHGLSQARMIGHITYLSQEMMTKKFGREKKDKPAKSKGYGSGFEVESYLDHQGRKFVDRFDANSYLLITRAMDEFDFSAKYGSDQKLLDAIESKFLIVALSEDWLFPPSQSRELANWLLERGCEVSYCELVAPHGHDAFLVDIENLCSLLGAFLPWVEGRGNEDLRQKRLSDRSVETVAGGKYAAVARRVRKGARVLDLGCGDGSLLQYLIDNAGVTGMGVDLDLEHVISVIDRGMDVIQSDIDEQLRDITEDSFDYVILNNTLQVVRKPRKVLEETLRIAKECIVTFPNFGNWSHRLSLLLRGRMPKGGSLPFEWYNTPNIHLFTLKDFVELCGSGGIEIRSIDCHYGTPFDKLLASCGSRNAGAEHVTICIARGEVPEGRE